MKISNQTVKLSVSLSAIVFSLSLAAQSGRRAPTIKAPVPVVTSEVNETSSKPAEEPLPETAEKNQVYRCSGDGSLDRILDTEDIGEAVVSAKDSDTRATITGKPKPTYTKEARRTGIQGFVTLKVLLSGRGKVARIRVVKGLPAGLTENAIRTACKMEFKPAMKAGRAVAEWVTVEYVFRLADSSVFTP